MWSAVDFLPSCPCTRWLPLAVGPSGHPDRSGAQIYHRSQTHHRLKSSKNHSQLLNFGLKRRSTVMEFGVLFYLQIKAVLMHLCVLAVNELLFQCVRPCEWYTPTRRCMCACSAWQSGMRFIRISWLAWACCVCPCCAYKFFQHAGLQQNHLC